MLVEPYQSCQDCPVGFQWHAWHAFFGMGDPYYSHTPSAEAQITFDLPAMGIFIMIYQYKVAP